jgi:pimeloyl-ACP methyl ester carboxylesterase
MAKVSLLMALGLGLLLVGGICTVLAWRGMRQNHVAAQLVIASPPGIDEARFINVAGRDQWITIRGLDRRNPVILMADGGPGAATSVAAPSAMERDFVLVEWDQPGAGKTYGRSGPLGPRDSIDKMADDGIAVAEYLRRHLRRNRVILVGVSWGTIVGVRMALKRPDLFAAYVGAGQFVNMGRGDAMAYRQVLAKAQARNDVSAVQTLKRIGPPPYRSQADLGAQRRIAIAYEPGAPSINQTLGQVVGYPRYTLTDDWNWIAGFLQSQDHFLGQNMQGPMTKTDLPALGVVFKTPVFFFQGDQDDITPSKLVRDYFAAITAPRKGYQSVADAGHFAFVSHGDAFDAFLKAEVAPLVK